MRPSLLNDWLCIFLIIVAAYRGAPGGPNQSGLCAAVSARCVCVWMTLTFLHS